MIIEKKKLTDLKPAPYNPRQSTAKQEKQLKASLEKFGVVEPIIFNKRTGYIVGGHFRLRELNKLGYKEIECVIVDLDDDDERELNIRLNANTGEWDWDSLANEWDEKDLKEWGLDVPTLETIQDDDEDDTYTTKVESPIYKPTRFKPEIQDLYNVDRYNELINEINSYDLPENEKLFLQLAATRHIEFNYRNIAEYYAQSDNIVQDLMENSALIIIDYNKAIELGFVKLYDTFTKLAEIDE
jgi:hypothetical protein